ncbi:ABC transporter ATP-binding protein [Clostridium formicaceticum]|uniref:ABC transporter n=1 Tax=Clostridium formicaceticum TaxID=1497 RepID=A0AAC9WH74_9CLOT|nr:ABC transporter ATP-binding protein [Clostridium formicaceticum]AOY77993.1 ABC transporter [Clostridium formicaceticum]ARE88621.1 putative ABC transporter ATP-binding protein [Clostridium formicaceticum]
MKDKQTLAWLYENSKTQLFPLLILILGNALFAGCGVLFALASRGVIDGAAAGEKHILIKQGVWLFFVIVLQLLLRILCRNIEVRIQGRLEMSYKTKLLGEIFQKDYAHTGKYHSGELMNRLTSDIIIVSEGVTTILPDFVGLLTKLLSAFVVLCVFDRTFALIFAAGGLLLFLTTKYFREKLKYLHKNVQEKDGVVRSFMQEVLESIIVVKIFGVEHEMEDKAAGLGGEYYREKIKKNTISILANSGFSFIFSMGYLYALVWSSFGLVAKTISFGSLTAILQLVGQVQTPFTGLSGLLPKVYGVIASAERMIELENLPDEIEINKQDINIAAIYTDMQSIKLEDISFRYDRDIVLSHADLTIEKGDFAAVSGISGIGKSTLLKLLLGVFSACDGTISIKLNTGEQIPIDRHTRKLFAYVPQGNLLLSGTIRENIAFVNSNATDEEIMAAAQVSCAAEFIMTLPHGLNTVIGEKGQGLSEGQAQRLAIARAVLCGAPILLLDEATSALDEATEESLLNNIKEMTDKTCIIISHKKAALSVCNKEIRIENTAVKTTERRNIIDYHSA